MFLLDSSTRVPVLARTQRISTFKAIDMPNQPPLPAAPQTPDSKPFGIRRVSPGAISSLHPREFFHPPRNCSPTEFPDSPSRNINTPDASSPAQHPKLWEPAASIMTAAAAVEYRTCFFIVLLLLFEFGSSSCRSTLEKDGPSPGYSCKP
jgi:hypothetical protein